MHTGHEDIHHRASQSPKPARRRLWWAARLSCIIPLWLPSAFLPAQQNTITFEHITVKEGLSQNTVTSIFQDSRGYMWFGTRDGLNRYDGYTIEIFRHDPRDSSSLSNNFITAIREDRQGTLWVGTLDGLERYDPTTRSFIHYDSLNSIYAIFEDSSGVLWIGTDSGLARYERESDAFKLYRREENVPTVLRNGSILRVYQDRSGALWLGTYNEGLFRFDPEHERVTRFKHDPADPKSLSQNRVTGIQEDDQGNLWMATSARGLNRFDRQTNSFTHFMHDPGDANSLSDNRIEWLFKDKSGAMWVGTAGGGLDRLVLRKAQGNGTAKTEFIHNKHDPSRSKSLSSNSVFSVYQDRTGTLWVGTNGGGVNRYCPESVAFTHHRPDKTSGGVSADNSVWSIYEDRSGTLWVGAKSGLSRLDRGSGDTRHYRHDPRDPTSLPEGAVRTIYEDRRGALWIGTLGGGLCRFDRAAEAFHRYQHDPDDSSSLGSDFVYTIYEDRSGRFWIGTNQGGGLDLMHREKEKLTHRGHQIEEPDLLIGWVIAICESRSGMLWLGTWSNGLIGFDPETGESTNFTHDPSNPHSLNNNYVFAIHEDKSGTLWIGTNGGGLNRLVPSMEADRLPPRAAGLREIEPRFDHFTTRDGLANDVIYGILEDDQGNLWLSTNGGLSRFHPESQVFTNYDVRDGLQSNEFNLGACFRSERGEMFFGGINGFNSFFAEEIVNPYPPQVVLTAFKRFGRIVDLDPPIVERERIQLSYKDDFFAFEFAALHYKAPWKNRYAYKMEGFDEDWIHIGARREATYTNLDPGNYTFRVKAANSDGVWNEEGASVRITITPPFWRTWWFSLMAAGLLASSLMGFHRYRVAQALRVERARFDEREQMRRRVARDFHDELGHTVTRIAWTSEILKRKLEGTGQSVTDDLQRIFANVMLLSEGVRDFIWEVDPQKESLHDLAVQLKSHSDRLFERTDIAFQLEGVTDDLERIILPMDWRQHLLRIFKEVMHNVLKHARGCRNLTLKFAVEGELLEITLMDDGPGFEPAASTAGNGLRNMRERAEKISGTLTVESQSGRGARVRFIGKLP